MSAAPVPLPGEGARAPQVRAMFDRIAPSYDLLNRVMTLRVDQLWRRRLIRDLRPRTAAKPARRQASWNSGRAAKRSIDSTR